MKTKYYVLFLFVFFSSSAFSETITVSQLNNKFSTSEVRVKKGDTVSFLNEDPFFHNVFSLSDVAMFDLGSYPQGESKSVTFDTVGEVEVECAIHSNMRMKVIVE